MRTPAPTPAQYLAAVCPAGESIFRGGSFSLPPLLLLLFLLWKEKEGGGEIRRS